VEECAARETLEETGVTMGNLSFRAVTNDVFAAEGKHYITIWIEGNYVAGEAAVNSEREASEVGWFAWQELPQPLFLPFENLLAGRCYPVDAYRQLSGLFTI
jgi:8-oxo-dGTP diphosphatase